jgi:UDP-2,3-diacylglucosamine hydrolase
MCKSRTRLYYFISDVHLGLDAFDPAGRERRFAEFLFSLPENTEAIYLLGDIFDFWYEYRHVVPRGFSRTLGALAFLKDRGVRIFFINGNHDVWTYNFLQEEIGVEMLDEMSLLEIEGRLFCLAHGDELMGDRSHIFLKRVFKNRFLQRMFSALHPYWAFSLATRWSKHNRLASGRLMKFRGVEDPLYKVAVDFEKVRAVDYFIFGHLHTPGNLKTPGGAGFYVLGEWIHGCDYLVYDSLEGDLRWESGSNQRKME